MGELIDFRGYGWMLGEGVKVTILVGVCSIALALALGLVGCWGKLSGNRAARITADVYTTVVRGVPELVLIILVYYGITTLLQHLLQLALGAEVLIDIDRFSAGVITLGFIYGAFATEVFRGAFLAIPKGQVEAAKAAGMSPLLMFRRIMMPQAWRYALPGLGNLWLVLIKATALMSVIQLDELMRKSDIAARAVKLPFTFYFAASIIYLGITVVSMLLQHRAEAWANRGVRRA